MPISRDMAIFVLTTTTTTTTTTTQPITLPLAHARGVIIHQSQYWILQIQLHGEYHSRKELKKYYVSNSTVYYSIYIHDIVMLYQQGRVSVIASVGVG